MKQKSDRKTVFNVPGSGQIIRNQFGMIMLSTKNNPKNGVTARPDIEKILDDSKLDFYVQMNLANPSHPDQYVWEYFIQNQIPFFKRVVIRPEERPNKIGIYLYTQMYDHAEKFYYNVNLQSLKNKLLKIRGN